MLLWGPPQVVEGLRVYSSMCCLGKRCKAAHGTLTHACCANILMLKTFIVVDLIRYPLFVQALQAACRLHVASLTLSQLYHEACHRKDCRSNQDGKRQCTQHAGSAAGTGAVQLAGLRWRLCYGCHRNVEAEAAWPGVVCVVSTHGTKGVKGIELQVSMMWQSIGVEAHYLHSGHAECTAH